MKIFNCKKFESIILTGAVVLFGAVVQPGMLSYAAEPGIENTQQAIGQSTLWEGTGDEWRVKDSNGGYLKNSWFQDDVTEHWYMLGAGDGTIMYSGLVTDQSTGKTYLMNTEHDGTYGRLISIDGTYTLNGQTIYLTFNQNHDGSYGAIASGLSEARSTGVKETSFDQIPTGSNSGTQTGTGEFAEGWRNKPVSEMTRAEKDQLHKEMGSHHAENVTIDTKGGTIDDSFLNGQNNGTSGGTGSTTPPPPPVQWGHITGSGNNAPALKN